MKDVKFYLLANNNTISVGDETLTAVESLACDLAASLWREGKRILLFCIDETQALRLDEVLWARDPNEFVPHNLAGEITPCITPIEIAWQGKRNTQKRDVLISLTNTIPDFASIFQQIIDFVPFDETLKIQARERYKQYRQLGWQLSTEQV